MTVPSQEVGAAIPSNTAHAVSVTLPTWEATVAYEEGEDWVVSKMKSGYPRFFIHGIIQELATKLEEKYGRASERCMVFPLAKIAKRCRDFMRVRSGDDKAVRRILRLATSMPTADLELMYVAETSIACIFFPESEFTYAKQYWQHSGEGVSLRMAEYVKRDLFDNESHSQRGSHSKQELQAQLIQRKSPSISFSMRSESLSQNESVDREFNTFIEQKYGRVLDLKFAKEAKVALRRRIAGKADQNSTQAKDDSTRGHNISENDVYLYPTGMAAIFNAHQAVLATTKEDRKSVCFGFPYVDTLNILRKFGHGCIFYGNGDDASLDELEQGLESGELSINSIFCECPSNPLLKTPNLKRMRSLADKYQFAVVIDETVGNFLNISVMPYADIVVSSLTKIFSGDSNVMGGSLILNPCAPLYKTFKQYFTDNYEDVFWAEDALHLERNSRDFEDRSQRVNETSLAVVDLLTSCKLISDVYYPLLSDTKKYYDEVKTEHGGYGGLISFVFHDPENARKCFNAFELHKGPSLGTNFTLACPYAILAHYLELDEVAHWGVDKNLIRISIGLEDKTDLLETLQKGLDAAAAEN